MGHVNVTPEIRDKHIVYGASDYNNPSNFAGSKSLNYAKGPSISRPDLQSCSVVPHTFKYDGEIGLFGAENYFTKISVNVIGDVTLVCYEDFGWECAQIGERTVEETGWSKAKIDPIKCPDGTIDADGYNCAEIIGNNLPYIEGGGWLSIELKNLKTGNQYVDDWLDVRIYTDAREEHPFDKMYVKQDSIFYLGFHSRNTRRLPLNIACVIGVEYRSYDSIDDKQLIMATQRP